MTTITTSIVKNAIHRYDNGERPYRFTKPRVWYLVGDHNRAYPLKYIYALAINQAPSTFNTSDPIRELGRLGFKLKREPKNLEAEFSRRVEKSLNDPSGRSARLAKTPRIPSQNVQEVVIYERNPDVVAEALARANGVCQACKKPAPFLKKSNGHPYLEVHHIQHLADGGEDTVENAIAVCPNCHRKAHHG